jgi:hypothetical protein
MTPKEKAKELVREFKKYAYYPNTEDDEIFVNELKTNAKQCALIAVDELIEFAYNYTDYNEKSTKEYLEKVKKEIENL